MNILIIDDEEINRLMLLSMLNNAGFDDCVQAGSAEEALTLMKESLPDLVLLDVVMPGMSGFELAPKIRELAKDRYLPILFITALEDKDSLVKCLEVGGNDFATKPFDKHILTAKIKAHQKIQVLSSKIEEQNKALRFYKQQVAREHAIVEHIFSNAIVNCSNLLAHFDCYLSPVETFNGDMFICEASPSGGVYFLVGDFTGHGLASAVGALPVNRAFREMALQGWAVPEIVEELNKVLLQFLPGDMFMAAVVAEVTADGSKITLWQGGMPKVLRLCGEGEQVQSFPSEHMALGILDADDFDENCNTFELNENDKLVICSDGLIEVADEDGQFLNESGVEEWCKSNPVFKAQQLVDYAKSFSNSEEFHDDVSVVIFKSQQISKPHTYLVDDAIPSHVSIHLNEVHLKRDDVLQRILQIAGQCSGVQYIRSTLYTLLSEMFSNALDHGILKMDSSIKQCPDGFVRYYEEREKQLNQLTHAAIEIEIESLPSKGGVTISVKDSGDGFDFLSMPATSDEVTHGRGISLIQALSQDVTFEDGGRKVTCFVKISE